MERVVQILGTAPNLPATLPLEDKERWLCNSPAAYIRKWRDGDVLNTYTRWFNMHSRVHMLRTYPDWYRWYGQQRAPKRIVLQDVQPDIPVSERFQKDDVLAWTGHRYITHSAAWFMALVGYERAHGITPWSRVELSGFMLRRDHQHDFERPCFFYWVDRLRAQGIEVVLPGDLVVTPAGDPLTYTGPLYGYETT